MLTFFATFFQQGGFFMWPIAALLFIGLVIATERFIKLRYVFSTSTENFMQKIRHYIQIEDFNSAVKYCNTYRYAVLPKVIKAGLMRAFRDERQVEQGIEVAMLRFYPMVKRNTKYLAVIANVATLVGLLGTIFGLISAFQAVAQADPTQKQAMLASGISIAMNTTAFGLITAIPCMLLHGFLSSEAEKIFDQVDEASATLIDMLNSRMYQMVNETSIETLKDSSVPAPGREVTGKAA